MSAVPKTYRIGELAQRLSVAVETIRYYEKEGLVPRPARSEGNYRLYSDVQRQRLEFVLRCRALDMTHQEIRQLLRLRDADQDCDEVNALLDQHMAHVAERLRALKRLQGDLKAIRKQCAKPQRGVACGILRELDAPQREMRVPPRTGVHGRHRAHRRSS